MAPTREPEDAEVVREVDAILAEVLVAEDGGRRTTTTAVVGPPGPVKPIHDYPICRSPVPRVKCHRHIDTVFVVVVLVVMLILVIAECVSMKRFQS